MTTTTTRSVRLPETLYNELAEIASFISSEEGVNPSLSVPQIISRLKEGSEEYKRLKLAKNNESK